MSISPSTILYDFAVETEASAPLNSILKGVEILDSKWQEITKDKGIVISNSEWNFAPQTAQMGLYDALMVIGFYCRVPGADTTERMDARDQCFALAEAFAQKLFDDQYLGGRVCDVLVLRAVDGMNNTNSDSFAIINLPIVLNPTGNRDFNLGDAK
ncbi:MAG: hypothetical protein JSS81_05840 [Acidobacteria bacterium]|nr:hypothetical protein [Acidobacteriota bacterium]